MIILDTSIWIEHLKNNQDFFPKISKLMENREILAVECVFGELLQKVKKKADKDIVLKFWAHLPKAHYENIAIEAGEYSSKHKLGEHGVGLIDAILLMHGIKSNARIWTLDSTFLAVIPEELRFRG